MHSRLTVLGVAAFMAVPCLFAQYTISLHSGSVQYATGTVMIDDQPFQKTITNAPAVKKGERLTTGADGAAEVLMTPGVFVRMVENSSLRMDEVLLSDTRVSVLQGSLMVECDEMIKDRGSKHEQTDRPDNSVIFTLAGETIEIRKPGVFRIDANPPSVYVVHGEVFVSGELNATVGAGKQLALNSAVPAIQKNALAKDDLYQFSEARSADSAYASNVASSSLFSAGSSCLGSTWFWMNAVGMYSYVPCGSFMSPYGYPFFGMNYGYLYDGYPFYMAPPALVMGGGGFGYGPNGLARFSPPSPAGLPSHRSQLAGLSSAAPRAPAVAPGQTAASSAYAMRIPAFRDALSTRPAMLTVSRASYLATAGLAGPSAGNMSLLSPGAPRAALAQNRFQGATSLHRGSFGAGSAQASAHPSLFGRPSSSSGPSAYSGGSFSGGGSRAALASRSSYGGSGGGGGMSRGGGGVAGYGSSSSVSSVSSSRGSFSSGVASGGGSAGGGHR